MVNATVQSVSDQAQRVRKCELVLSSAMPQCALEDQVRSALETIRAVKQEASTMIIQDLVRSGPLSGLLSDYAKSMSSVIDRFRENTGGSPSAAECEAEIRERARQVVSSVRSDVMAMLSEHLEEEAQQMSIAFSSRGACRMFVPSTSDFGKRRITDISGGSALLTLYSLGQGDRLGLLAGSVDMCVRDVCLAVACSCLTDATGTLLGE